MHIENVDLVEVRDNDSFKSEIMVHQNNIGNENSKLNYSVMTS